MLFEYISIYIVESIITKLVNLELDIFVYIVAFIITKVVNLVLDILGARGQVEPGKLLI